MENHNEQKNPYRKKRFRTRYIINPGFQFVYIGYTLIMSLGVIFTIFFVNNLFYWSIGKKGEEVGLPPDHVFFRFIENQQQNLNFYYFLTSFFLVSLLIFGGLYISHRVAGPLYRLHRHMKEIADGDSPPREVFFRKGDFFSELSSAYNEHLPILLGKQKADPCKATQKNEESA